MLIKELTMLINLDLTQFIKKGIFISSFLLYSTILNAQKIKTIPLDIELENTEGEMINTSNIPITSDFIILDFWNHGCKPCIVQLNSLAKNYDSLKSRGITVIAVSTFPPSKASEKLIKKYNWPFELYYDTSDKLFKKYNGFSVTVPLTIIFDSSWKKVYKQRGALIKYKKDGELVLDAELLSQALNEGDFDKLTVPIDNYFKVIEEYKSKNNN